MSVCLSQALPWTLASDIFLPTTGLRLAPAPRVRPRYGELIVGYFVPSVRLPLLVGRVSRPGLLRVVLGHASRCLALILYLLVPAYQPL